MKYFSVVILMALMAWTWGLANSQQDFSPQDGRDLETQIESIVAEYVKKDRPGLKELTFQQIYTEVIEPKREIKVHLRYQIEEATAQGDSAVQGFEGSIILTSKDGKAWEWANQNVRSPFVEFKEGSKVE